MESNTSKHTAPSLMLMERSIIKKYRKELWGPFIKAIKTYELVEEGDKIAVAISGGKDSMLLAKLFQELKKHGKDNFDLEFITMDPGYKKEYRTLLEDNCERLGIPVKIYDSDVFEVSQMMDEKKPCYLCARMRRGFLYAKAKELGCNKLALGHHYNDIIETTLMNVLYAGNYQTMMPKLKAQNFEGMELIRPMTFIEEYWIVAWRNYCALNALDCACVVTERNLDSTRAYIKELIAELKLKHKDVEHSIYRSGQNVNVDRVLGYKLKGVDHSFLEDY